jgi:hypothetical protein
MHPDDHDDLAPAAEDADAHAFLTQGVRVRRLSLF